MMSPKDNDTGEKRISNKFNKNITETLQEKSIENLTQQEQVLYVKSAMRFNKDVMVKPILNYNSSGSDSVSDSNTSIKASNKTCNLIVKMINDVSKSTISGLGHTKQNNKTPTTAETTATATNGSNTLTEYSRNCSEGGKNKIANDDIVVDDFHNNNKNYIVDNEQPTTLNEVGRESLSLVDEQTLVDPITKQEQAREEFEEESLVTVKPPLLLQNFSKRMRHKNIIIKPLDDSYQRTVDLDALNARAHNSQCELLEFKTNANLAQKDYYQTDDGEELKFKSLAERKALLKKEFFKDLNAEPQAAYLVKLKSNNLSLNKRILKKQHNLKLKIPRDCNKLNEQPQTKQDLKPSLVALRKLDLQKNLQKDLKSFTPNKSLNKTQFPKVKELAQKFVNKNNMILPQTKSNIKEPKAAKQEAMVERNSPLSDEGCNIGLSPYSSDDDNDSILTTHTAIEKVPAAKNKDKVARSASSDSALGLEVDEAMDVSEQPQQQQKRRMTLTVTDLPLRPALLPLAEPTLLPDSLLLDANVSAAAINNLGQSQIPSKVLLEERVVEILDDPRSAASSRRESSQSCFSDYPPGEMQGVRFVRTPSVVVSDYSDDITCGITLEEIEYFRAQRLRRRRSSLETSGTEKDALDNSSDISASSSCSNLYYCGSTISALDGAECLVNGVRQQLARKTSDCSTCSISGDEDNNFSIPEQAEDCQDITDMLANQHLTSKRAKKVGMPGHLLTVDTIDNNNV